MHHHGDFITEIFTNNGNYVGETVNIIDDVDTDEITVLYLKDYVVKYDYSKTDFHYFQCDGKSIQKCIRLLYDDDSVRELIKVSLPLKKMIYLLITREGFNVLIFLRDNLNFLIMGVSGIDKDDVLGGNGVDKGDIVDGSDAEYLDDEDYDFVDRDSDDDSEDPNYVVDRVGCC